jgi:hypothetical protein
MAVAVIFGLGVATMLTLVVVPVLFSLLDDLQVLCARLWGKWLASGKRSIGKRYNDWWARYWENADHVPVEGDPGYEKFIKDKNNKE